MFAKKSIWRLAVLISLMTVSLLVSGCQAKTPTVTQPPADSGKPVKTPAQNTDNQPAQNDSQQAEKPDNQADYSAFKEYSEPGAYSIKYPDGWELQGGGEKTGFEILAFYKADPEAKEGPHGGQDPNSAKVAVSIDAKSGRLFTQVVEDYYNMNELNNRDDLAKEELEVNGKPAVRYYYTFDNPIITLLIDIDQDRYAMITGYHGGGSEKAQLIKEIKLIQESFKAI